MHVKGLLAALATDASIPWQHSHSCLHLCPATPSLPPIPTTTTHMRPKRVLAGESCKLYLYLYPTALPPDLNTCTHVLIVCVMVFIVHASHVLPVERGSSMPSG
jgi:hypothetical protein